MAIEHISKIKNVITLLKMRLLINR